MKGKVVFLYRGESSSKFRNKFIIDDFHSFINFQKQRKMPPRIISNCISFISEVSVWLVSLRALICFDVLLKWNYIPFLAFGLKIQNLAIKIWWFHCIISAEKISLKAFSRSNEAAKFNYFPLVLIVEKEKFLSTVYLGLLLKILSTSDDTAASDYMITFLRFPPAGLWNEKLKGKKVSRIKNIVNFFRAAMAQNCTTSRASR